MDPLSVSRRAVAGWVVLSAQGEIDAYTAPVLRAALADATGVDRPHVVVDLSGVHFLDSSGLGALVIGLRRVRAADGRFRVVTANEWTLKLLRVTGLDSLFEVHPTVDAAMRDSNSIPHEPIGRSGG